MRLPLTFTAFCFFAAAAHAAGRPASDYPILIHVVASTAEGLDVRCGKRIVATIEGQFVSLMGCNDPRPQALGDLKARLLKDQVSADGDLDRRYGVLLPNGSEYTLFVMGLCDKQATSCFGYSLAGGPGGGERQAQ